ncbi:hypothetical protein [Massilicoli timonensis]|uniref:Uncharacterized protein n=1 Tax=Massilicoli timonensis TaxID=2015901 RepID=A0ABT1SMQ9_9FIRM|nr:hypothetical protein [Massilicoli timonensis]MCQ5122473.1 hypothetical protein [Massilicoli timonensis]
MNLMPDLFSFAYVPGWYAQLEELADARKELEKVDGEKTVSQKMFRVI